MILEPVLNGSLQPILRSVFSGGSVVSPPPSANRVAWYRKGVGITSSVGAVSNWADQTGLGGRDLAQASGVNQPALQGDNTILFDGATDSLKTPPFTLNQPETIYLRIKVITWTATKAAFGGNVNDVGTLYMHTTTPNVSIFAGGFSTDNGGLAVGSWGSVAVVINGSSSSIDAGGVTTGGDPGVGNMGGFTLGGNGAPTDFSNVQIAEAIVYSVAHDAATRAQVIAYLNTL